MVAAECMYLANYKVNLITTNTIRITITTIITTIIIITTTRLAVALCDWSTTTS